MLLVANKQQQQQNAAKFIYSEMSIQIAQYRVYDALYSYIIAIVYIVVVSLLDYTII